MWLWPAGRKGFLLGDYNRSFGYQKLIAIDLDTAASDRINLKRPAPVTQDADNYGVGNEQYVAIDQENGRLFVAYGISNNVYDPTLGSTQTMLMPRIETLGRRQVCANVDTTHAHCMGGVTVVDAASLEQIRDIPLALTLEGVVPGAVLRAMTYAPPRSVGDGGKLLMVLEDVSVAGEDSRQKARLSTRHYGATPVFAIQIDADSGRMDWLYRLDMCRGNRDSTKFLTFPDPAVIFRSPDLQRPAIFVGCHARAQLSMIVRLPLDPQGVPKPLIPVPTPQAGEVGTDSLLSGATPSFNSAQPSADSDAVEMFTGPDKVIGYLADPLSQRIVLKVAESTSEVYWVFDGRRGRYLGTIGIGSYDLGIWNRHALEPETGRLYVLAGVPKSGSHNGGLFLADIRRTPIPQAQLFGDFNTYIGSTNAVNLPVEPPREGRGARIYARVGNTRFDVLEDRVPSTVDPEPDDYSGRTLDLVETDGVTARAYDGTAQGFGARVLMVGGLEAAARVAIADPVGIVRGTQTAINGLLTGRAQTLPEETCTYASRELRLAAVGPDEPNSMGPNGAQAVAQPVVIDDETSRVLATPLSRCAPRDWEQLWSAGLFSRPPVAEPQLPRDVAGAGRASCLPGDGEQSASYHDPVASRFSAAVTCAPDGTQGWSQARAVEVSGLVVGQASSSFRLYLDPGRGQVVRVESMARGVDMPGLLRIDSVRTVAESWANGRAQPVAEEDQDLSYDPNCDFQRSAGTCLVRSIVGFWTPEYSCGPCGDEEVFLNGANQVLGGDAQIRMRAPDERLARGAANGFISAVQKPVAERGADVVLNDDLLLSVLPGLEITRFTTGNRVSDTSFGIPPRGRQIIQLAGVAVSSSYGIQCLLIYDEATNTCSEGPAGNAALTVELRDSNEQPLAAGGFEVRRDSDNDGIAGLADELIPDGACVTSDDGVGTCNFSELEPGRYLITQVLAPPGYARVEEAFAVDLVDGEARVVTFINNSALATIGVQVRGADGSALEGAEFAVYADPDADGTVDLNSEPLARCVADRDGKCSMTVAPGSYVLVQLSAPNGLEPVEPLAFVISAAGQVAAVDVVNYTPLPEGQNAAGPDVRYSDPPTANLPRWHAVPLPVAGVPGDGLVELPRRAARAVGGTAVQIIRAPGDALRLLSREPLQAAAFAAALMLTALAFMGIERRRRLHHLTTQSFR